jgi:hypothetical protein
MLQLRHTAILFATWVVASCARESSPDPDIQEDSATIHGVVDDSFTAATQRLAFKEIAGIAISNGGDVGIIDGATNRLSVLMPGGGVRVAAGPDRWGGVELAKPCCLAFGQGGRLWIRDNGNARYVVLQIEANHAVFDRAVPIGHRIVSSAPTTFDRGGRLIDIGDERDSLGGYVTSRLYRDATGEVEIRQIIPQPTPSVLGAFVVRRVGSSSTTEQFFYPPRGPKYLIAHAPGGEWAEALSSSYNIMWRDETGHVIHAISKDVRGPQLTKAERHDAAQSLREDRKYAGRKLPFKIPERQPPLHSLFFDSRGRLWVHRSSQPGARSIADVYERGVFVSTVSWPANVRLESGAVHPDFAIGVVSSGERSEQLRRIIFHPAVSRTAMKGP